MITSKNKWIVTVEHKNGESFSVSVFAILPRRTKIYKNAMDYLNDDSVQSVSLELDLDYFNRNQQNK